METSIDSAWLGRMQTELGVLSSNVMLLELQRDQMAKQITQDAALIDALKRRVKEAEAARTELAEQLRTRKPKNVANADKRN
ncbi:hypothetical protein AAGS40_23305 [Paraburkholderia sp. PREW-6R]|uniref:hypothetical protein n=1 Tax=Paraburkholderia sp. PREW-6R TaxID=3141544 RepID=UPI0031F4D578